MSHPILLLPTQTYTCTMLLVHLQQSLRSVTIMLAMPSAMKLTLPCFSTIITDLQTIWVNWLHKQTHSLTIIIILCVPTPSAVLLFHPKTQQHWTGHLGATSWKQRTHLKRQVLDEDFSIGCCKGGVVKPEEEGIVGHWSRLCQAWLFEDTVCFWLLLLDDVVCIDDPAAARNQHQFLQARPGFWWRTDINKRKLYVTCSMQDCEN